MPTKRTKAQNAKSQWVKVAERLGGIATIIALLYAVPTAYATQQCLTQARYCPYALIGPDAETVLKKNKEVFEAGIEGKELEFKGFRLVPYYSFWSADRVDVYARSHA